MPRPPYHVRTQKVQGGLQRPVDLAPALPAPRGTFLEALGAAALAAAFWALHQQGGAGRR
jgi:hypothetical protein